MPGGADVTVKRINYKGWAGWQIESGPLGLVLVPQVGGRIMGMTWRGQDLSFTQPEYEGHVEDVLAAGNIRAKKQEIGFRYWGGDKTWLGPQSSWVDGFPFLDLDSGPYHLQFRESTSSAAVAEMTSPVCRETGVQIIRTVMLSSGKTDWTVKHQLINRSNTAIQWGVWSVHMVRRPATIYLPRSRSSSYPDGVKVFPEEGESARLRHKVVSEIGSLVAISCREPRKFKFGVDAQEGWMLGVLDVSPLGLVGYRKQFPVYQGKPYGHGCTAEVYNSAEYPYLEMEIHGPVTPLNAGESFELEERQSLFELDRWPQDEDEIRRYLFAH